MLTKEQLQTGLCQFTKVDGWYYHTLGRFVFTDGIKWLCDQGDCRWLLLELAYYQFRIKTHYRQMEAFQIWHLQRLPDSSILLECSHGTSSSPFIHKKLQALPFVLDELTLWVVNGVLLLPGEYLGGGHRGIEQYKTG